MNNITQKPQSSILKNYNFRDSSNYTNNSSFDDNSTESNKKRILVIDDETLVRKTFLRFVNKLNEQSNSSIEILEAENALVALNLIYENFIYKRNFDVIIIDECMPFMKGSTLMKLIYQLSSEGCFPKPLIISHTAFDTTELKTFLKNSGADIIWNKPVSYKHFKNCLVI